MRQGAGDGVEPAPEQAPAPQFCASLLRARPRRQQDAFDESPAGDGEDAGGRGEESEMEEWLARLVAEEGEQDVGGPGRRQVR